MKRFWTLALLLAVGVSHWYVGRDRNSAMHLELEPPAAPSEPVDCVRAEEVGDKAAGVIQVTGVQSEWASKFARDVGRRGYSNMRHQACPDKD